MSNFAHALLLLAERTTRLDDLTRQFRERRTAVSPSMAISLLALAAGIIVAFWLLAQLAERREPGSAASRPWGLLWSLSRAHGLQWSEIWCLCRLARHQRLSDPARLFLEPERFSPEQAGPLGQDKRLELLRERLFSSLTAL